MKMHIHSKSRYILPKSIQTVIDVMGVDNIKSITVDVGGRDYEISRCHWDKSSVDVIVNDRGYDADLLTHL